MVDFPETTVILNRFLSLSDRKMRAFALGEYLLGMVRDERFQLIEVFIRNACRNNPEAIEVIFSLTDLLEGLFRFEIESELSYQLLTVAEGSRLLTHLVRPPKPHRFLKRGEIHVTDIGMDYLPLGVKRSLAKKMDRVLLRRMLFEKDPHVVRYLLSNPLVTEKDVLKMASLRPTTAEAIREIYASDKWVKNYVVKEALIRNPYCSFRIALMLLLYMQKKEIESIAADVTLHPELRVAAEELLKVRF